MHLEFDDAGDGAEKIFDGGAHSRERVGLELADVDDDVRFKDRRDDVKEPADAPFGVGCLGEGAVKIQVKAVGLGKLTGAGGGVDTREPRGVVDAAGAFSQRYGVGAVFPEPAHDGAQYRRMYGGGFFRAALCDKVWLYDDSLARKRAEFESAGRFKGAERGEDRVLVIFADGGNANGFTWHNRTVLFWHINLTEAVLSQTYEFKTYDYKIYAKA